MRPSVQALLAEIIDYAGLFPPARLPLAEAIRNHDRYRQGDHGWLLGRFVCPASRLSELGAFADEVFPADRPLSLAVLGGGDPAQDRAAIADASRLFPRRLRFSVYECKWNGEEAALPTGMDGMPVALEIAVTSTWSQTLATAMRLLGRHRPRFGLKIRCGGEAAAPTSEQLALAIAACRDARVPLKFTAGLHHALRRGNATNASHGFLNVFIAGVLAQARALAVPAIMSIIEESDGAAFRFTEDGLHWREHAAGATEIAAARRIW